MSSRSSLEELGWRESIENCRTWNAQMSLKRRARLPYYDHATAAFQDKCGLYLAAESKRRMGQGSCAMFYPPRRWEKKQGDKSQLLEDPIMELKLMEDSYQQEMNNRALLNNTYENNPWATLEGEIGPESDEDFPAPGRKRSRKSKGAKGGLGSFGSGRKTRKSRAKHVSMDDDYDSIEPAHYCGLCGKSFVHKSTLAHHIKNHHETPIPPGVAIPMGQPNYPGVHHRGAANTTVNTLPPPPPLQKMVNPMQKCVLCNHPIQPGRPGLDLLLQCTDCKKLHHPQCMNFDMNMTRSIQKYNWQCTDCKSCSRCGKSENDAKMLFCDQCDRGFHLYCLNPPLETAPQGRWTCTLCG